MTRTARFGRRARLDVVDATRHYGAADNDVGDRFADGVVNAVHGLVDFPERCPEIRPGIRQFVLRPFPYLISCAVERHEILVIAVVASMRDPAFIDELLDDRRRS